jgi:hypothetical protein
MQKRSILSFTAAIICVGCVAETTGDFKPIEHGNGFGYVTHVRGVMDPSLSASLWYQDAKGKRTAVWSHIELIQGDNPSINNNVALLVGGRGEVYDDGVERLTERLIAFEAPVGPAMDITDQVFQKYCAESGVAFTNIVRNSFASLNESGDGVQMTFTIIKHGERGPGSTNVHGTIFTISWHDIVGIMQDVKKTGKLKKERRSGVEYLQKE